MSEALHISVVVPAHNEQPTLYELYERLTKVLARCCDQNEIIFVNDGSTDGSAGLLRRLSELDERVRVIELRTSFGKAAALHAGFQAAEGNVIVTLDADLQDVPEEIPRLLQSLSEGVDLVTGRKTDRQDPWTRVLASWIFNRVVTAITGVRVRDMNSGLKLMRREVADEVPMHGQLHRYLPILAGSRGFNHVEVDVSHQARRVGRSRYGWSRYFAGLLDTVTVLLISRYETRPSHFFGVFGLLCSLLAGGILTYLSIGWVFGQWIGNRPLLIIAVMLLLVGIQTLFFGALAELLVLSTRGRDPGYSTRAVYGRARLKLHSGTSTDEATR